MPRRRKYKFSIEGKPLYPHLKLTRERFPRILATRIIANDDAEYFGAFLNRSNARLLVDLVNRVFRLRTCELDIDGSFNYPCAMYFKRRCMAPCVGELCGEAEYAEMVSLLRLFLLNDRPLLQTVLAMKISEASESLDFELAVKWRDILRTIEEFWADTRHAVWVDGLSDTFIAKYDEGLLDIFLISQKGQRVLGERIFTFKDVDENEIGEAIRDVIEQCYRVHAPKEIRVSNDFEGRSALSKTLSAKFGRKVPVVLLTEKNRKVSTDFALYRSSTDQDIKRLFTPPSAKEIGAELKKIFRLPKIPKRICAVDVSHISGQSQVAASVGWSGGNEPACAGYDFYDGVSETAAVASFVADHFSDSAANDLILIDGGPSQINAVTAKNPSVKAMFVAAVKPPGQHDAISHFLTSDGGRVEFDAASQAMLLLQRLRDDAHDFANQIHRDTRDFAAFYELAEVLPSLNEADRQRLLKSFGSYTRVAKADPRDFAPVIGAVKASLAADDLANFALGKNPRARPLVVPIRFQEENGAADDLRPIEAFNRTPKKRPK